MGHSTPPHKGPSHHSPRTHHRYISGNIYTPITNTLYYLSLYISNTILV